MTLEYSDEGLKVFYADDLKIGDGEGGEHLDITFNIEAFKNILQLQLLFIIYLQTRRIVHSIVTAVFKAKIFVIYLYIFWLVTKTKATRSNIQTNRCNYQLSFITESLKGDFNDRRCCWLRLRACCRQIERYNSLPVGKLLDHGTS